MWVRSDVTLGRNRRSQWRLDARDEEDRKTTSDASGRSAHSSDRRLIFADVDRFTKMAHFIGIHPNATAKDVTYTFLPKVRKVAGLLTKIILDMDEQLSGQFWESLFKILEVKQRMSTAYHRQTDGQNERTNQVREGYLRTFVNHAQNDLYQLLPLAEHVYNNSATNADKKTPFMANYAFHPQMEWMKESEANNSGATM